MGKLLRVLCWGALFSSPLLEPDFLSGQSAAPVAAKSPYVGSTICKGCHPDISLNFYKNAHYRSVAAGNEAPEKTGCEGCHGPGSDHVAGMGKKSAIRA